MNIRSAIIKGQKQNKAITRKSWQIKGTNYKACIYHRIDNVFYWFSEDPLCGIPNKSLVHFCVEELMANDWQLSNALSYHGDEIN